MSSMLAGFALLALVSIIVIPLVNLYSAINTTLEVITIKNKIKLKEYKKIHKDMF